MTAIEREFDFQAAVHFENEFILNSYSIVCSMNVETDSIREQNIAMDRIKCFLSECLANSIFVQESEKKVIDKYKSAGIKVCTLPEEPYDQIITLMLFHKINAITEGRLELMSIVLDSNLSDGVRFIYDLENASHPYDVAWWADTSPNIDSSPTTNKKDKIVKLVKNSDWAVYGLDWKERTKQSAEIIFTSDSGKNQP